MNSSTVSYSTEYGDRDFRLFEVTEELLQCLGHPLVIIGEQTSFTSVLTTKNTTYSLKKIETSNNIFITQESVILGNLSSYYELSRVLPKISDILPILQGTAYNGLEEDVNCPPDTSLLMTKEGLQARVQASEYEFNALLEKHGVVELNGYMRLVSPTASLQIAEMLFDLLIEKSSDYTSLHEQVLLEEMDVDPLLLRHVLRQLGQWNNDMQKWELSIDRVGHFAARILVKSEGLHGKFWPIEDFMAMWKARTPSSMQRPPREVSLQGVATAVQGGAFVLLVECNQLPIDARSRIKAFLSLLPQATEFELSPYLNEYFGCPGLPATLSDLLLEHCRYDDSGSWISKDRH